MTPYNYLVQNSKIKKMTGVKTYNFGIPAYQSANGERTCPNAGACKIGCYATMHAYTWGVVKQAYERRYALTKTDTFVGIIDQEIKRRKIKRVRIHDSGDFYSIEYLNKWLKIMHLNPDTEFYAYTKMVSMIKEYRVSGRIPENFKIVYSFGGTQDKLINTQVDRHSTVFETKEQLEQHGYSDASKNDAVALGKNSKVGLIYHGIKRYDNTHWNRVKKG